MKNPIVLRQDELLHLRYELNTRIHSSQIYPLRAPNGSSLVITAHEKGLHLLWRGGRLYKSQPPSRNNGPKTNGTSRDAVMIIDSDEEEDAASDQGQKPRSDEHDFDDDEAEYDPKKPYDVTVSDLNLPLDTAVLHMSFPRIPRTSQSVMLESLPDMARESAIVACACADYTVRVLAIPLYPPSPKLRIWLAKQTLPPKVGSDCQPWFEQMVIVRSVPAHRSIPKKVSVKLTTRSIADVPQRSIEDDEDSVVFAESQGGEDGQWDLIVASCSDDLSGLLIVTKVPLHEDGSAIAADNGADISPCITEYLQSAAVTVQLNPALQLSENQADLLVAGADGVVKLYKFDSSSELDSGTWMLSLYTGSDASRPNGAKSLVDACWAFDGNAIVVLTVDGEWGVWDVGRTGPKGKGVGVNTITGSIPTKYTINGWVGTLPAMSTKSKRSSNETGFMSRLAPMTPGTRKIRQAAFFTGSGDQNISSMRGGLCVCPTEKKRDNKAEDETILIWHGDKIVIMPSLLTHWQDKLSGSGNLFVDGAKGRPRAVQLNDIGGELRNAVIMSPEQNRASEAVGGSTWDHDLIVTGERSFTLITQPLREPPYHRNQNMKSAPNVDQYLLNQGELDLRGMNRILNEMSRGPQAASVPTTTITNKRKADFAHPG
ncbi:hypothetical protein MMC09_007023 [Bachmanniomyces sp. S44760]|nr:hypothetical protein [Bachmanniomyces sp. S44760]